MRQIDLQQARALHDRILVFDGHNDTPVERVHRGEAPLNWMRRDPAYHMDVPRMREGGFDGGFFIVGNGPTADVMFTLERTLAQIDAHPDDLRLVHSSQDVADAKANDQIGILMTIEGAQRWLRGELDMVRLFYRMGIRCLGITHGEGGEEVGFLQGSKSPFGPCTMAERNAERKNARGLTDFGRYFRSVKLSEPFHTVFANVRLVIGLVVGMLLYAVARNLPWAPFTDLAP